MNAAKALCQYYADKDRLYWLERDLIELDKQYKDPPAIGAVDPAKPKVSGGEASSIQERRAIWIDEYPRIRQNLNDTIDRTKRRIQAVEATLKRYKDHHRANHILIFHFLKGIPVKEYCEKFSISRQRFHEIKREIVEYCYQQDRELFEKEEPWLFSLNTQDAIILRNMLNRVEPQNEDERRLKELIASDRA